MEGFMALIIEGENLNFQFLKAFIGLEPDRTVKKGQKRKLGKRVWESLEDRWIYEMKFLEENFSEKVSELTDILNIRKDKINKVKETASVKITFSIVSELGQFGYTLTSEQLKTFSSLGIDIDFDILSYGLVEMEESCNGNG